MMMMMMANQDDQYMMMRMMMRINMKSQGTQPGFLFWQNSLG